MRTEKALIDRKEKMLKAADLTKWGSGPFSCFKDEKQMAELREKLLNDKSVAFTYMLPKESQECEWKKEELHFLTNQCLGEVQRVSADNGRILRTHFRDLSSSMCSIINTNHVLWADFLSHFSELCAKDLELNHE